MSNKFENKLLEIFEDLLDEHFPKGQCRERGQAMVLIGMAILKINEVAKLKTNSTGIDFGCSDYSYDCKDSNCAVHKN